MLVLVCNCTCMHAGCSLISLLWPLHTFPGRKYQFLFSIVLFDFINTSIVWLECKIYGGGNVFRTLSIWREKIFICFGASAHWGCQPDVHVVIIQLIKMSVITAVQFNQSSNAYDCFSLIFCSCVFFAFWFTSSFSISKYKITYVLCTLGMPFGRMLICI